VELVDTQDLKSCDLNSRTGSSPVPGTSKIKPFITERLFLFPLFFGWGAIMGCNIFYL
jgi:hypothetical protein